MITGGNATVYVSSFDEAIEFYVGRLGMRLTNRFGDHWATVEAGPSYWTTSEAAGAGLTIGLHPPSAKHAAPGTVGSIGFGFETYEPIDGVAAHLTERGVRVDSEIIRSEAGNFVAFVDQDGLPTYLHELPPDMVPDTDLDAADAPASGQTSALAPIAGGHAIVYVSNMDVAIRFYTDTLGMKLTYRFGDQWATVEAGRLLLAIHPQTARTPVPGTRGSVMLGLTIDEPIEQVVAQMAARGVRITGPIISAEVDRFVEFEDPDGNGMYLWERRRNAAEETNHRDAENTEMLNSL